jgi:hypothetical protein
VPLCSWLLVFNTGKPANDLVTSRETWKQFESLLRYNESIVRYASISVAVFCFLLGRISVTKKMVFWPKKHATAVVTHFLLNELIFEGGSQSVHKSL